MCSGEIGRCLGWEKVGSDLESLDISPGITIVKYCASRRKTRRSHNFVCACRSGLIWDVSTVNRPKKSAIDLQECSHSSVFLQKVVRVSCHFLFPAVFRKKDNKWVLLTLVKKTTLASVETTGDAERSESPEFCQRMSPLSMSTAYIVGMLEAMKTLFSWRDIAGAYGIAAGENIKSKWSMHTYIYIYPLVQNQSSKMKTAKMKHVTYQSWALRYFAAASVRRLHFDRNFQRWSNHEPCVLPHRKSWHNRPWKTPVL